MCLPAPILEEEKIYRCIECDWEYGPRTAVLGERRCFGDHMGLFGYVCYDQMCPRCQSPYYYAPKEAA